MGVVHILVKRKTTQSVWYQTRCQRYVVRLGDPIVAVPKWLWDLVPIGARCRWCLEKETSCSS